MLKNKSINKSVYCLVVFMIFFMSIMFCACETNKGNESTNLNQPEIVNYPVEGIWCATYMYGDIAVKFYYEFLPNGIYREKRNTVYSKDTSTLGKWVVANKLWEADVSAIRFSDGEIFTIYEDSFTINKSFYFYHELVEKQLTFKKISEIPEEKQA